MPEERKLVTVLFADIVGSTELGSNHDPEVIRAVLSRAFESASAILTEHGGTVEKFIGDAVMAVFGVPAAHDDDPDRAVRAAFILRDRIADPDPAGGPQLRVRIGVNTGEVVTGSAHSAQFLVTGPAVNAAARLQQAAAPGEIVVGDLTKRLTGGSVSYGNARDVDARGIGKVAAWPAVRVATDVPQQRRGLPGMRAALIGREHEMRLLIETHARLTRRAEPQLVTIYGPAGSGKSRLTSEFIDVIGPGAVRVGRCLPYGEGITYYAVQLIVRSDVGIEIADQREIAISKLRAATLAAFGDEVAEADAVARRVSVLAGLESAETALPEVSPDGLREELAFGFRRYFERRAASSPIVLVFEDIHWAEPGLLDLIENLAEWSRARLLLLCLARPDFREVRPTWGSGAANSTAISLAPLTPDETRQLIAALLTIDDLPEGLRSNVVTRAEGNPLYVEEFLRMLMETGRIEQRGDRWTSSASIAAVEVPPTIQGLITARLDRVGPDVKALLQRASLAGRLFSTDALTALADGTKPDPALLRDAIRRDLLIEADERALGSGRVFRFKHVLIRDVAYSTLSKAERSRLHDRYGRWLETTLGDRGHEIADIIAHHAEQAYLLARELNPSVSVELGARALDLLLDAARNASRREDTYAALNLYTRAKIAADDLGSTPNVQAELVGRQVLLRRELAAESPSRTELDEAIAAVRTAGPSMVLAQLLMARANEEREPGDAGGIAAAEATLDEALAIARSAGETGWVAEALWQRAFTRYWIGDLDGMYRWLLDAYEQVQRTESNSSGKILFWLARSAANRGDFTEAASFSESAIAAMSMPHQSKFFRAMTHVSKAWILADIGDFTHELEEARHANALVRELGLPNWVADTAWRMGEASLEVGDADGARRHFQEAADLFERLKRPGQIPEVRARLARALVQLGDVPRARENAEVARAVALPNDRESRYIAAVALGEVYEAEGNAPAAEALFHEAIAMLEPSGMGDKLATARIYYARFLLRRRRGMDAREQLDRARAFYRDPLVERQRERIDALLREAAARTA